MKDFYSTIDECLQHSFKKQNTNSRYISFCQTHFTAGDEQQFENKRIKHLTPIKNPIQSSMNSKYWIKYNKLNTNSVSNTFKYIFHKFKKGIFIQIRNGKVETMLPFSKHNYTNEWSNLLSGDYIKIIEKSYQIENRKFNPKYINKYTEQWYSNNALIRYEFPIQENDSGICAISDMFNTLCEKYGSDIPDLEFFVNKRDHPLLHKDEKEPYDYIFKNTKLKSHLYDTYSPLFSMCGGDDFADILIPTWDDWARVCMDKQKYFPKSTQYYRPPYTFEIFDTIKWEAKKSVAFFRGSSTGFEINNDNPRIKVARMSLQYPDDIDAGITSWNARPRVYNENDNIYIHTFDTTFLDIPIVPFVDITEQAKYKYIINIDGHVCAYRLSLEMYTGSVIMIVESKYKLWYSHLLIPFVHYVPIKRDLSDLLEKISWCRSHDSECQQIGINARNFYEQYLTESGILRYLRNTLIEIKNHIGDYQYKESPSELLRRVVTIPSMPSNLKPIDIDCIEPFIFHSKDFKRTYEGLQSLEWYIRQFPKNKLVFHSNQIQNHNSCLDIYEIRAFKILSKKSNISESTTEALIGMHCINPLLRIIPYFSYTFDYCNDIIYTEYFPNSITLFDYLKCNRFEIKEYLLILLQIASALDIAQKKCLFMHYDLYPWNILLVPSNNSIDHLINPIELESIHIQSKYTPIIIDYGKSNGIIDGKYYGYSRIFNFSTIHDLLCLLVSSMHIIINNRILNKKELYTVFKLSEFFSDSKYTNYKKFQTIKELKQFLTIQKKYSNMINSDKYELNQKTPLQFIFFLHSSQLLHLEKNFFEWKWRKMHRPITSFHAYQYICCKNDTERYNTYLSLFDSIKYKPLDSYDIFSYYIFTNILNSILYWTKDTFTKEITDILNYLSPLEYNIHMLFPVIHHISIGKHEQVTTDMLENIDSYTDISFVQDERENDIEYLDDKYFIIDFFIQKLMRNKSITDDKLGYEKILKTNEIESLRSSTNISTFKWLLKNRQK